MSMNTPNDPIGNHTATFRLVVQCLTNPPPPVLSFNTVTTTACQHATFSNPDTPCASPFDRAGLSEHRVAHASLLVRDGVFSTSEPDETFLRMWV